MLALRLHASASLDLTVTGDMTRSLFRRTSDLLADGEYQEALEYVASRRTMARYHDMVDFLFCELVVGYRAACQRYYRGAGPALRDLPEVTAAQIAAWDIFLASALHVAHAHLTERRKLAWKDLGPVTKAAIEASHGS